MVSECACMRWFSHGFDSFLFVYMALELYVERDNKVHVCIGSTRSSLTIHVLACLKGPHIHIQTHIHAYKVTPSLNLSLVKFKKKIIKIKIK